MTAAGRRLAPGAVAVLCLAVVVLGASTGGFWATHMRAVTLPAPRHVSPHVRPPTDGPPPGLGTRGLQLDLTPVLWVVVGLLAALALVAAVRLVQGIERGRFTRRRGRLLTGEPDATTALRTGTDEARSALDGDDPRVAVLQCWVRLEQAAARADGGRAPSQTSAEFARAVLTRDAVDPAALDVLHALYRRARFSDLPVDEADRVTARAALDRVAAAVGREPVGAP